MSYVYKQIQARLSVLDDNIGASLAKNTDTMVLNLKETLKIIGKESKNFKFSKGIFPSKLLAIPKGATAAVRAQIRTHNTLHSLGKYLDEGGFLKTGKTMTLTQKGFKELSKKNLKINIQKLLLWVILMIMNVKLIKENH